MEFKIGDEFVYRRTFEKDEVAKFMDIAKYRGKHHEVPNEDGELMLQGLLTATLPTKIGGDYNLVVYRMEYDLVNPVYTGEEITCKIVVEDKFKKKSRTRLHLRLTTTDERNNLVLGGLLKAVPFEE